MTWLTAMKNMLPKWPRICSTCRKYFPILSSFMTYHRICRLTRRVPLVEQELLTLPEHLSSPPVFSGVHITRSLVLCVCFVDRCTFSFGHCAVGPSSIYGFWLLLWYLQTLLTRKIGYYHKCQFNNCYIFKTYQPDGSLPLYQREILYKVPTPNKCCSLLLMLVGM